MWFYVHFYWAPMQKLDECNREEGAWEISKSWIILLCVIFYTVCRSLYGLLGVIFYLCGLKQSCALRCVMMELPVGSTVFRLFQWQR